MRILAIDSGTTSTRASVVERGVVIDKEHGAGGARDVARGNSRSWLANRIREVAERVAQRCGGWDAFDAAIAFGMLSSEHGILEVPHLRAPDDVQTLAASLSAGPPDILPIPLLLVPGVVYDDPAGAATSDFMRGEETEVAGLLSTHAPHLPLLYVSPGSHSKFIAVDEDARIVWSVTTLAGELVWALSQETLLAGLIEVRLDAPDHDAARQGAATAHDQGLSRALYVTRLQNRLRGMTQEACSSFIHGAIASSDLVALTAARDRGLSLPERVVIAGSGGFAAIYRELLTAASWTTDVEQTDVEFGPIGAWALADAAPSPASHGTTGAQEVVHR